MQERTDFSAEGASSISIREYGEMLRRRRVIILQTFVIVLVAGVLITLFQPLVYQASAKLLLEPPIYTFNTVNNDPLADVFRLSTAYTPATQVELLKSKPVRDNAMKLMDSGKTLTGYNVSIVEGGTSIVELTAEGDDPNAVQQTANKILQAYVEYTNSGSKGKLEKARDQADLNLNRLLKEKATAEKELLDYKVKNNVTLLTQQTESDQKLYSELTQTYLGQMSRINFLKTEIAEISSYLTKNAKKTTQPRLTSIQMDPNFIATEKSIAEKEAEIASLAGEFGENNDLLVSKRASLSILKKYRDNYKKQFVKDGNKEFLPDYRNYQTQLGQLNIELASLQRAAEPNRAELEKLRVRLAQVPTSTGKINDLENKIALAAKQIEYFTTTKQNIELRLNTTPEAQKPIEEAIVPSEPIRPKKPQNILFSGLLGLFLGLCFALLQELLDDRINSPEEAERVLHLPNLGHVPLVEEEGLRLIRDISTFSPLMESYRSLRTNINFAAVGDVMHSIVVTSSVPAEGKSTTAANLAMAMALDGKRVIIVDADLRRPSLHKLFRTDSSPGLTDVLVGTHEIQDVVRSSSVENVSVIPAGSPPPNPSELLGSARMDELIMQLESIADVVLFDSPPTLVVADSVVLAAKTDGVLLVIGFGETKKANSRKALELLKRANAKVLGTVLNRVEGPNSGYYYGKYYVAAPVEGSSRGMVGSEPRALSATTEADEQATAGKGRD